MPNLWHIMGIAVLVDIVVLALILFFGHMKWRNWRRINANDHTTTKTWSNWPNGNEVHTVPDNDSIDHEWEDCGCSPKTEPVARDDGSVGWQVIHNATDGRPN